MGWENSYIFYKTINVILNNNPVNMHYSIVGKFGKYGELSMICQTKTIQISTYNYNNLLADVLICQTFFRQILKKSQFAKLSRYTI